MDYPEGLAAGSAHGVTFCLEDSRNRFNRALFMLKRSNSWSLFRPFRKKDESRRCRFDFYLLMHGIEDLRGPFPAYSDGSSPCFCIGFDRGRRKHGYTGSNCPVPMELSTSSSPGPVSSSSPPRPREKVRFGRKEDILTFQTTLRYFSLSETETQTPTATPPRSRSRHHLLRTSSASAIPTSSSSSSSTSTPTSSGNIPIPRKLHRNEDATTNKTYKFYPKRVRLSLCQQKVVQPTRSSRGRRKKKNKRKILSFVSLNLAEIVGCDGESGAECTRTLRIPIQRTYGIKRRGSGKTNAASAPSGSESESDLFGTLVLTIRSKMRPNLRIGMGRGRGRSRGRRRGRGRGRSLASAIAPDSASDRRPGIDYDEESDEATSQEDEFWEDMRLRGIEFGDESSRSSRSRLRSLSPNRKRVVASRSAGIGTGTGAGEEEAEEEGEVSVQLGFLREVQMEKERRFVSVGVGGTTSKTSLETLPLPLEVETEEEMGFVLSTPETDKVERVNQAFKLKSQQQEEEDGGVIEVDADLDDMGLDIDLDFDVDVDLDAGQSSSSVPKPRQDDQLDLDAFPELDVAELDLDVDLDEFKYLSKDGTEMESDSVPETQTPGVRDRFDVDLIQSLIERTELPPGTPGSALTASPSTAVATPDSESAVVRKVLFKDPSSEQDGSEVDPIEIEAGLGLDSSNIDLVDDDFDIPGDISGDFFEDDGPDLIAGTVEVEGHDSLLDVGTASAGSKVEKPQVKLDAPEPVSRSPVVPDSEISEAHPSEIEIEIESGTSVAVSPLAVPVAVSPDTPPKTEIEAPVARTPEFSGIELDAALSSGGSPSPASRLLKSNSYGLPNFPRDPTHLNPIEFLDRVEEPSTTLGTVDGGIDDRAVDALLANLDRPSEDVSRPSAASASSSTSSHRAYLEDEEETSRPVSSRGGGRRRRKRFSKGGYYTYIYYFVDADDMVEEELGDRLRDFCRKILFVGKGRADRWDCHLMARGPGSVYLNERLRNMHRENMSLNTTHDSTQILEMAGLDGCVVRDRKQFRVFRMKFDCQVKKWSYIESHLRASAVLMALTNPVPSCWSETSLKRLNVSRLCYSNDNTGNLLNLNGGKKFPDMIQSDLRDYGVKLLKVATSMALIGHTEEVMLRVVEEKSSLSLKHLTAGPPVPVRRRWRLVLTEDEKFYLRHFQMSEELDRRLYDKRARETKQ